MMASPPTSPSTPDNTPQRMRAGRSFTLPPNASNVANPANASAENAAAGDIGVLFTHPSIHIRQFSSQITSPGGPQGAQGSLPWASPTENTVAAGPMEIYRAPGSVNFIHAGKF